MAKQSGDTEFLMLMGVALRLRPLSFLRANQPAGRMGDGINVQD
jgi:hypothetical protein